MSNIINKIKRLNSIKFRFDLPKQKKILQFDEINSHLLKKAIGKISFKCDKGLMIKEKVDSLNSQKTKSTVWIDSIGVDESGQEVSKFKFNWSILLKE